MSSISTRALIAIAALACLGTTQAWAQKDAATGVEQYRAMLAEDNPAELSEMRGESLWKTKRGANNISLEQCNLGLGPGVIKGAYAQMPRYFEDTGKMQDLESRLLTCMNTLQAFDTTALVKRPFGSVDHKSDMEALVAYVVAQSRGMPMKVSLANPKARQAYEIGKEMFFYRAGTHDFSCATCHGEDNKRIRLQDLPNLTTKKGAQVAYTTWPAYRVSQGELRTMQWRLWDCFRQQRFPEPKYTSDATIALTTFLAANANGAIYAGPAIKR